MAQYHTYTSAFSFIWFGTKYLFLLLLISTQVWHKRFEDLHLLTFTEVVAQKTLRPYTPIFLHRFWHKKYCITPYFFHRFWHKRYVCITPYFLYRIGTKDSHALFTCFLTHVSAQKIQIRFTPVFLNRFWHTIS